MVKKVLVIGGLPPPTGGMETVMQIHCSLNFNNYKIIPFNVSKNKLIKSFFLINLSNFLYRIFKLFFFILILKPDIIHINLTHGKDYLQKKYFFFISKLLNKKIVLHVHGGKFLDFYNSYKNKNDIRSVFNKSDIILVLTDLWKKKYIEIFNLKNIDVLINPFLMHNINNFTRIYPKNNFIVLFVGKMNKDKGVYDLIQAISLDKSKNRKYVFVGPFEDKKRFFDEVERLNIKDKIEVIGEVLGDERFKYFASADVLVLPSYAEGFGIVLLEAMAFGLPIISTNVGGIPDIVKKRNGILINPGDVKALAKAINTIRNSDRNKYKKININEAEKYSVEKFKEKLENTYDWLLK